MNEKCRGRAFCLSTLMRISYRRQLFGKFIAVDMFVRMVQFDVKTLRAKCDVRTEEDPHIKQGLHIKHERHVSGTFELQKL